MNRKTTEAFKSFLKKNGADKAFVGLYKQYRFEDNSEDIEDYYENVSTPFAIIFALNFNDIKASGVFDKKYWTKLHFKWNQAINNNHLLNALYVDKEKYVQEANAEGTELWFEKLVSLTGNKQSVSKNTPNDNEIRFKKDLSTVLLNEKLSGKLIEKGYTTMGVYADKNTDSLILTFGDNEAYDMRSVSAGKLCCQNKALKVFFESYIPELTLKDYHFMTYREIGSNKAGDKYAILVERNYRTVEK